MEKRVQLRGHCQHCGRMHAANPMVAKHGYTVEYGWFNGVCNGADYLPLEVSRAELDSYVMALGKYAVGAEDEALKLEQKEVDPEGIWERYSEMGHKKRRLKPYADLSDYDKGMCRENAVRALRYKAKCMREHAEDLVKLAKDVHGKPLKDVLVDKAAKEIKVGDTVKLHGKLVVVTKIAGATARGVGPGINGHYVDHVYWMDGERQYGYPKRYARKVAA
jgi:hypothetical protein